MCDLKLHQQLSDWALREADDVRCHPDGRGSPEYLVRTLAPEVVRLRAINTQLLGALQAANAAAKLDEWERGGTLRYGAWQKLQDALALVGVHV